MPSETGKDVLLGRKEPARGELGAEPPLALVAGPTSGEADEGEYGTGETEMGRLSAWPVPERVLRPPLPVLCSTPERGEFGDASGERADGDAYEGFGHVGGLIGRLKGEVPDTGECVTDCIDDGSSWRVSMSIVSVGSEGEAAEVGPRAAALSPAGTALSSKSDSSRC